MNRWTGWLTIGLMVVALSACSTQTAKPDTDASSGSAAKGVPPPATSPLAKIKLGMNKGAVREALGSPTDENSYATGKAWIPWYFGNDARRTSWYYKSMGRVVFADGNIFGGGGNEVIRVDYDPTESGVAR